MILNVANLNAGLEGCSQGRREAYYFGIREVGSAPTRLGGKSVVKKSEKISTGVLHTFLVPIPPLDLHLSYVSQETKREL